jgi:hypothetical protein
MMGLFIVELEGISGSVTRYAAHGSVLRCHVHERQHERRFPDARAGHERGELVGHCEQN